MSVSVNSCKPSSPADHSTFLALLLPKIELHARISFNHVRCPATRADKVAECVALGWAWYSRLCERGKDVSQFSMAFVFLVARAVKSGRRVCGQEKAGDVMSPLAQQGHGFKVESLPASTSRPHENLCGAVSGQRYLDTFEERLWANSITPPDQQAMFRIDFVDWLKTLTPRERRIIQAMARNERTKDLAKKFEVSPGRISQMRREFCQGWKRFCGDNVEEGVA
jgi:hypothetical protein